MQIKHIAIVPTNAITNQRVFLVEDDSINNLPT
jgi:hypothetical protein